MPKLYVITCSNGAGKSTVGPDYLPLSIQQHCHIFDGDKLFMEKQRILWDNGIRAHKEAKKMAFAFVEDTFERLVEEAIAESNDFAYEGHFTNEATWSIPKRFKESGYSIHLIFFGLANTELSELRVVARAKEGGHYVDPLTVSANFYGNLEKLNLHYDLFDSLEVVDTSETGHRVLCVFENGKVDSFIESMSLPFWFIEYLPALADKIRIIETKH